VPLTFVQLALVFTGGALGSMLRFAVPFDQLESLWLVNILGTVFLAWVNNSARISSPKGKAFWATGFAGGFTTMSGIAVFISTAPESPGFAAVQAAAMFAVGIAVYHLAAKRFGGVTR
jgi:fluoride ion exporter CrcB/FEX